MDQFSRFDSAKVGSIGSILNDFNRIDSVKTGSVNNDYGRFDSTKMGSSQAMTNATDNATNKNLNNSAIKTPSELQS